MVRSRAGRRRARSPSLALGATRPVNPHICCRQPREGTTERDCSSRRTTDHLSGPSAGYQLRPRFSLWAPGSPESLFPGLPLAAAAPGRLAAANPPGASLRRPCGSEGRAGAAAAAAAAAGRPEEEVEKKAQAGRASGVERAPQDARVEPAGDREGVIAPPPRPSPAPAPRLPRIPGPGPAPRKRSGVSRARSGPAATAVATHALTQAAKSIQPRRPRLGAHRRRGSRSAPPSSLPTLQCQLQSCGTGRGGEEAAAEARLSPARLSLGPQRQ